MELSRDVGEPLIKAFESCLRPVHGKPGMFCSYRCPAGVWTIGWGTTNEHGHVVGVGTVWTQAQCDKAFREDAKIFAARVRVNLKGATVTQAQFDALTSWAYNTGGPASSAVWTYARKGDVEATCERLARWNKGGGRVLNGLVRRRKAECALYRGNVDEALRIAGTRRADETRARASAEPVPKSVTARAAAPGVAVATSGAAPAMAGSNSGHTILQPALFALGAVVLVAGIVVVVRRVRAARADWA